MLWKRRVDVVGRRHKKAEEGRRKYKLEDSFMDIGYERLIVAL